MASLLDRKVCWMLLFLNIFNFVKSSSTTSTIYNSGGTNITLLSSGCNVTKTANSAVVCGAACSASSWCRSFLFSEDLGECKLSWLQRLLLPNVIEGDWIYYSIGDWRLVFRGVKGADTDMYAAFIDGTNAVTDDITCMSLDDTSCSSHFRSRVIDNWSYALYTRVKLSVYSGGEEVANIVFNRTGSSLDNWFHPSRMLSSTWTQLLTETSHDYFSLAGVGSDRRFFIQPAPSNSCATDKTYLIVSQPGGMACSYDNPASHPQIYYATSEAPVWPESMSGMGSADFIAIFVQ